MRYQYLSRTSADVVARQICLRFEQILQSPRMFRLTLTEGRTSIRERSRHYMQ